MAAENYRGGLLSLQPAVIAVAATHGRDTGDQDASSPLLLSSLATTATPAVKAAVRPAASDAVSMPATTFSAVATRRRLPLRTATVARRPCIHFFSEVLRLKILDPSLLMQRRLAVGRLESCTGGTGR